MPCINSPTEKMIPLTLGFKRDSFIYGISDTAQCPGSCYFDLHIAVK